jgi:GNAT superfamily N-acetyltransferase
VSGIIKIREIKADSLDIVRDLAMDIWPKAYRNIITPQKVDAMLAELYTIEALEGEMRDGHVFWLARFNDQDVAYSSAVSIDNRLWLKKLYCRHEFRGHGIGNLLITKAVDHFEDTKSLSLNVNKDNLPAIDYYLRHGFNIEAEVPVTMGPFAFVDLIMSKDLEQKAA